MCKLNKALSYHGCSCHDCVIALLLTGFDFGLQVCRRVKILALLPGAAALDVVHANSDGVIRGVNHWAVTGVSKAAICLSSRTVSTLELAANLRGAIVKKRRYEFSIWPDYVKNNNSMCCMYTSSLSVRCSFCEGEDEDEEEEEEELWTGTEGFPESRSGVLERLSVGMRLIPWLIGVMYEP